MTWHRRAAGHGEGAEGLAAGSSLPGEGLSLHGHDPHQVNWAPLGREGFLQPPATHLPSVGSFGLKTAQKCGPPCSSVIQGVSFLLREQPEPGAAPVPPVLPSAGLLPMQGGGGLRSHLPCSGQTNPKQDRLSEKGAATPGPSHPFPTTRLRRGGEGLLPGRQAGSCQGWGPQGPGAVPSTCWVWKAPGQERQMVCLQAFPRVAARGGGPCSSAQNLQWLLMASRPQPAPVSQAVKPGLCHSRSPASPSTHRTHTGGSLQALAFTAFCSSLAHPNPAHW